MTPLEALEPFTNKEEAEKFILWYCSHNYHSLWDLQKFDKACEFLKKLTREKLNERF